jgi:hypothetical protein
MKNAVIHPENEPPKKLEEKPSAKPQKSFDPKKAVNFKAIWKKHDDEEKRNLPKKIITIVVALLIPIAMLFFILSEKDRTKIYTYNTFVMEKRIDEGAKQPYKVTVITIMNEYPPETFECTINIKILPLWVAFNENQNFKITAESDYKYEPKMICSLINESMVVEILEQLK